MKTKALKFIQGLHFLLILAVIAMPFIISSKTIRAWWCRMQMNSANAETRRKAMAMLTDLEDYSSLDTIIKSLDDKSPKVRLAAVRALVKLGPEEAVESLIKRLEDGNDEVKNAAVDALSEIGPPAVEPLIPLLKSPSANLRWRAAETLGRIGDKRAVGPLVQALQDQDPFVREKVVIALGGIKDPEAVKALKGIIGGKDENLKKRAIESLGRIGDQKTMDEMKEELEADSPSTPGKEEAKLDETGNQAAETLIEELAGDATRGRAMESLERMGKRAVDPLCKALKNKNTAIRISSAVLLGRIKDPQTIKPLLETMKNDKEDEVRGLAAVALGQIGDRKVFPELIEALKNKGPKTRQGAVDGLTSMPDPQAIEPLLGILRGKDKGARQKAVRAFGMIGQPAVEPLIKEFQSNDPRTRRNAALALGMIGAPCAERMMELTKGSDNQAKWCAMSALGHMRDRRAETMIRDEFKVAPQMLGYENYDLFIGYGIEGSEKSLEETLNQFGDMDMATEYNSTLWKPLMAMVQRWAVKNGVKRVPIYYKSELRWNSY